MRNRLIAAALLLALAATVWLTWRSMASLPPMKLSLGAMIALPIGIVLTIGLGAGLMALLFISARRGHDNIADLTCPDDESKEHDNG